MRKFITSKNSTKKLIALWLVFIMMLTPVLTNLGGKKGVKAADPTYDTEGEYDVILNDAISTSFDAVNLTYSVNVQLKSISIKGVNGVQKINLKLPTKERINVIKGTDVTNVTVEEVFLVNNTATIDPVTGAAEGDKITNTKIDNSVATYCYYAKVKVESAGGSGTKYVKMAEISFVNVTTDTELKLSDARWIGTENSGITYAATSEVTGVVNTSTHNVGEIRYGYAKCKYDGGNLKTGYADYASETGDYKITWSTTPPNLSDGEYVGFVGVFAKASSTVPISNPTELRKLVVDKSEPNITNSKVCYNDDVEINADKALRNHTGICISAEVSDTNISSVALYKDPFTPETDKVVDLQPDNGVYKGNLSANVFMDNTKDYKIKAVDKAGNVKWSDALPRILALDSNRAKITSATWDGTTYKNLAFTTGDNLQHTLKIVAEAYDPMSKIVIKYKDVNGDDKEISEVLTNPDTAPEGYYSYNIDIKVPKDAAQNENGLYKEISAELKKDEVVKYTENNLGELLYDQTKPQIVYSSEYNMYLYSEQPSNPNWINKNTAITNVTVDNTTKKVSFGNISITAGQGVDDVSYVESKLNTISDSKVSVTNENDYKKTATLTLEESTSASGTSLTWNVSDVAGNENTDTSIAYIDLTSPTIGFNSIKTGTSTNNDSSVTIFTTKDSELYVNPSDSLSGVKKVQYVANGRTYDKESNLTEAVKLKDILGEDASDGEYTITIKAFDVAGNESDPLTVKVKYDNAPPVISSITLVQSTDDGVTWSEVDTSNLEDATYFINTSSGANQKDDKKYAYKFVATDADIDVTPENIDSILSVTDTPYQFIDSKTDLIKSGNEYTSYFIIDKTKLQTGQATTVSAKIKDMSGNESEFFTAPIKVRAVSGDIIISDIKVIDSDNHVLTNDEISEIGAGTNGDYVIKATVEGPCEFANIYLAYGSAVTEIESKTSFVYYDNTWNSLKRYKTEVEFDLPKTTDIVDGTFNYMDLKIGAKDKDEASALTPSIFSLLYDKNEPIIIYGAKDSNGNEVAENTWVKDAKFDLQVKSGLGANESDLAQAKYTVDGVGGDVAISGTNATINGVKITESSTTDGTAVTILATDKAGNHFNGVITGKTYTYLVDASAPVITELKVDGNAVNSIALTKNPKVTVKVTDNLTLENVKIEVTYPDGTKKGIDETYAVTDKLVNGATTDYSYTLEALTGSYAPDGVYTVKVTAVDKAGNEAIPKTLTFEVDNTAPSTDAYIADGTKGGKTPREDGTDVYYRSNVTIGFKLVEKNLNTSDIVVKDNDKVVNVTWTNVGDTYTGSYTSTAEGTHTVSVAAKDKSSNVASGDAVTFVIDKTLPTISMVLNGLGYTSGQGVTYLTGNASLNASISDMTEDAGDLNIRIISKKPDQSEGNPSYVKTASRSFDFAEEADYTVSLYAVDMAGNTSDVSVAEFRIDKTAPELTISGASDAGTSGSATTVTFNINEAFWWDATGSVSIYRRAGDGQSEALLKTIDVRPTAASTSVSETLTESGVYRFEFTASDRVGHRVEKTGTFTVDRNAPVVAMTGVNNYDVTSESVSFVTEISDEFYANKKVNVVGTVTDINGKVSNIDFGAYNIAVNPTVIEKQFTDDGIYDIEIVSTDVAGNSTSQKVHFTIDKTNPAIGDLSAFDGKTLKEFNWDIDLDELVSDLTVCETHLYLNGSEYDGISDVEDGSYTLLVTAKDELGHEAEKSVTFVLDTKAPTFIVTGVENGMAKQEPYNISISLQLSEDELLEVTLNGETIVVNDNTANITVDTEGEYELYMKAIDVAGNESEQTISFIYGQEKKKADWWIWIVVAVGVVLIGTAVVVAVKKNGKE